jgi:glycine/D-amino acid oxidase-like deaminating enzyme/nitrite reductase/ring-hydroxylating ferredoxin subunit
MSNTKDETGQTRSLWVDTASIPLRPALAEDVDADVCVVGAGIAGLTTAYLLAREGRTVVVLDDGTVGSGETGRTTAHLSNALDDRYSVLEKRHGVEGARLAAASHTAAIDRIEQIVRTESIDCGFTRLPGYLFVPPGEPADVLDREWEAATAAGVAGLRRVDRAPIPFDTGPALLFPRQGQFHPLRYLQALAAAIERQGGRIFNFSHAATFEGGTDAHVVVEDGATVRAGAIVVATNVPVNDRVAIHTKQAAYRSYVVGFGVPHGSVPLALYWDTGDPYHYVRLQAAPEGGETLIVGGEDHKTGQADDADVRVARLVAWARERFPMAQDIAYEWSGQVLEPVDGMAFIGRNPMDEPNVYVATGDSGHGMTHGTIAGILITDLIAGRENPWAKLYDPSRITVSAGKDFLRENVNVAVQYADWMKPSDIGSLDHLFPGEGAVVRRGLKRVAAYRDESGQLHERSATCPHLGCVVDWNRHEKSWDCPCHGSRFAAADGRVLNGPAVSGLAPLEDGDKPARPAEPEAEPTKA